MSLIDFFDSSSSLVRISRIILLEGVFGRSILSLILFSMFRVSDIVFSIYSGCVIRSKLISPKLYTLLEKVSNKAHSASGRTCCDDHKSYVDARAFETAR